jgi:hypothetical protein
MQWHVCRRSPSRLSTCRTHCLSTQGHHRRSPCTQSGPRRMWVAKRTERTANYLDPNCLILYVLAATPPGFAVFNPPRSPARWSYA